jgi:hypothetical protein
MPESSDAKDLVDRIAQEIRSVLELRRSSSSRSLPPRYGIGRDSGVTACDEGCETAPRRWPAVV